MRSLPSAALHKIALGAPLLGIVTAAILLGLFLRDRYAVAPAVHPSHALHAAHAKPTPKRTARRPVQPKLSQFERELRMTPRQLMNRWNLLIGEAALRFKIPQPWIRAVLAAESGGRTMSTEILPLTSRAGALGLMQLMPETYKEMRALHGLGPDPHDPRDNIFAGAAYLRILFRSYGYPTMFSAYNDGPGNLEEKLRSGGLLPAETRDYVARIARALGTGTGLHGVKVKFTRPNGAAVWIDSAAVVSVRAALVGEYAPGVLSVITVGRIRQGVCENLPRTRAILRGHGARV